MVQAKGRRRRELKAMVDELDARCHRLHLEFGSQSVGAGGY